MSSLPAAASSIEPMAIDDSASNLNLKAAQHLPLLPMPSLPAAASSAEPMVVDDSACSRKLKAATDAAEIGASSIRKEKKNKKREAKEPPPPTASSSDDERSSTSSEEPTASAPAAKKVKKVAMGAITGRGFLSLKYGTTARRSHLDPSILLPVNARTCRTAVSYSATPTTKDGVAADIRRQCCCEVRREGIRQRSPRPGSRVR